MAQNIIYSPWEITKDPWLSLMTTLLLFGLLWLFSFVSAFLTSLMKLILGLKFSIDKRQAEDVVGGGARTIVSRSVAIGQVLAHAQLLGTLKNYSRLLQQSQEFERWMGRHQCGPQQACPLLPTNMSMWRGRECVIPNFLSAHLISPI